MNSGAEELAGSIAIPKSALDPKREKDGFVRLGVDVVFRLDVLKPPSPKGNVSDGAPGANAKKQMSLELDDWS
ncbi:hypothetical protein PQR70_31620 [Paraburkholderia madseniana]|uniref:hypothetical protein n=1 Tax=Paraburkholderia madseniana TaxID=2599607 RepID=UPI0038BC0B0C